MKKVLLVFIFVIVAIICYSCRADNDHSDTVISILELEQSDKDEEPDRG